MKPQDFCNGVRHGKRYCYETDGRPLMLCDACVEWMRAAFMVERERFDITWTTGRSLTS